MTLSATARQTQTGYDSLSGAQPDERLFSCAPVIDPAGGTVYDDRDDPRGNVCHTHDPVASLPAQAQALHRLS